MDIEFLAPSCDLEGNKNLKTTCMVEEFAVKGRREVNILSLIIINTLQWLEVCLAAASPMMPCSTNFLRPLFDMCKMTCGPTFVGATKISKVMDLTC